MLNTPEISFSFSSAFVGHLCLSMLAALSLFVCYIFRNAAVPHLQANCDFQITWHMHCRRQTTMMEWWKSCRETSAEQHCNQRQPTSLDHALAAPDTVRWNCRHQLGVAGMSSLFKTSMTVHVIRWWYCAAFPMCFFSDVLWPSWSAMSARVHLHKPPLAFFNI